MRIEAYFRNLQDVIDSCALIQSTRLTFDKRSTFEGYIRGELYFSDGSILHVREFVTIDDQIDRLTYAYHYMSADQGFVFRYDNTGHHRKLNLPTFPHHKHDGSEEHITSSPNPSLAEVLAEIEGLIKLIP